MYYLKKQKKNHKKKLYHEFILSKIVLFIKIRNSYTFSSD